MKILRQTRSINQHSTYSVDLNIILAIHFIYIFYRFGMKLKGAREAHMNWKRARYQPNYLLKGISISIIKNIILIINRFTKKLVGKVLHLTMKELVDFQFSMISKYNG
jgi:hypothetical protein